ncbi:MAG: Bax inhibitor-1 family protein [Solirubrobacteraceae bacterium]|jgi:FtsH-binding integral membrane protein
MPTYDDLGYAPGAAISREHTGTVFGQVMGLVALTVGCAALGAYVGHNLSGGAGLLFFIGAFVCIFGLNIASTRSHEQLAIGFLFGLGLCLGLAVAPVIAYYAHTDPAVLWQATGATGGFVAALGAVGYATRRDLSIYARTLFWALVLLIVFGLVAIFVSIPHANIIYCVLGLVIFGGFTIVDFNRLRGASVAGAVQIAAGIFLDIFNIFLLFLRLFGNRE